MIDRRRNEENIPYLNNIGFQNIREISRGEDRNQYRPTFAGRLDFADYMRLLQRIQQPVKPTLTLDDVTTVLDNNPQSLPTLESYHLKPSQIGLLIFTSQPLVVSRIGDRRSAFRPQILCTSNAIRDLTKDLIDQSMRYGIFVSDNRLLSDLAEWTGETNCMYTYDPGLMRPEDYIALAAQGLFNNEGKVIDIPSGNLQPIPYKSLDQILFELRIKKIIEESSKKLWRDSIISQEEPFRIGDISSIDEYSRF